MSAPKPYVQKAGDIICRRSRGKDEHLLIHPQGTYSVIPDLRQWAKLGGRWVCDIACADPRPPREVPAEILHVVHLFKNSAKVVKRQPFPTCFRDQWDKATDTEKLALVREDCRLQYDMSHFKPLMSESKLDTLLARRFTIPRGQPFPTNNL